jgi:hypothetical protein
MGTGVKVATPATEGNVKGYEKLICKKFSVACISPFNFYVTVIMIKNRKKSFFQL